MIKKDLVQSIKFKMNKNGDQFTLIQVENFLDAFDESIAEWSINTNRPGSEDKTFSICKYGKLKVTVRKQRNGVNPKTLEKIVIPQKNTIKFVASKELKTFLNN